MGLPLADREEKLGTSGSTAFVPAARECGGTVQTEPRGQPPSDSASSTLPKESGQILLGRSRWPSGSCEFVGRVSSWGLRASFWLLQAFGGMNLIQRLQ